MHSTDVAWPPAYRIKRHRLAKSVKLRPSLTHGLEITVPYRFSEKQLPAILDQNRDWIIKQLQRLANNYTDELPAHLMLHALNELWQINYIATLSRLELFQRPQLELVLTGKLNDKTKCREKLVSWLRQKAEEVMGPMVKRMSEHTQLPYEKITIRDQKTLWGSCTADKSLNFNYKLIFLPLPLMQHVIIHELCHTKHLNHSMRFWNLVATFDPAWRDHKRELRRADKYIPGWLNN